MPVSPQGTARPKPDDTADDRNTRVGIIEAEGFPRDRQVVIDEIQKVDILPAQDFARHLWRDRLA